MKPSKLTAMVLLTCAAAIFWPSTPGWAQKGKPQPPPQPPADPAIAYIGYRSWAHTDLMVMNADGTNQKVLLSRDTGGYFDPAWSPDSSRIAYCANLPGGYGIYLMNKDGSGICRVVAMTNDCLTAGDPQWSPNGSQILYMDYVSEPVANAELFLVEASCNAGSKTNLTNTPAVDEYEPAWSFDGTRIATVASTAGSGWDLLLYPVQHQAATDTWTVDFSHVENLTANGPLSGQCCLKPNWSQPSADTLAIGPGDIYVVDVANPGSPLFTNLTATSDVAESFPGWSPSGQIVHSHDRAIWVMNHDGSGDTQLAAPSKTDRWTRLLQPEWRRTP